MATILYANGKKAQILQKKAQSKKKNRNMYQHHSIKLRYKHNSTKMAACMRNTTVEPACATGISPERERQREIEREKHRANESELHKQKAK